MPRILRGALLQATWTGDKESMIQKHEGYAHEAAKQGAQVMLFQELFYGPYFCQCLSFYIRVDKVMNPVLDEFLPKKGYVRTRSDNETHYSYHKLVKNMATAVNRFPEQSAA